MPVESEDLAAVIEQLNAESAVGITLDTVVDQAVANVPNCTLCSVFIRQGTDGVYDHERATSDSTAEWLDDLQLSLDEGPCLDLAWDRELIRVVDTRGEERWPRWAQEAGSKGVRSALSVRLPLDGRMHACLNMYASTPDAFDEDAVDLAEVYARLAAVALQNAWESAGLRSAMHGRLAIGVAQGILMQEYGISLDQAFEVLRRRSTETNTKLRVLARDVVQLADPKAFGGGKEEPAPR